MPAVSKAQQRFFGMVRAAQKGEMDSPSPEVAKVAATIKRSDVKKFASTNHKGLPEKKEVKEALRSSLLTDKKFMKKVDSAKKGKKKFSEFSKDMEAAKKRTYDVDKKTPYNVHKNTRYY